MLHNFLLTHELDQTKVSSDFDSPVDRTQYIDEVDNRELGNSEKQRRQELVNFKSPAGSLPWQEKYAK